MNFIAQNLDVSEDFFLNDLLICAFLGRWKDEFICRTAIMWTLEGKEIVKLVYSKTLKKYNMDYWFIPSQCSQPLYLCSIAIPFPCARIGNALKSAIVSQFLMCCFLISASVAHWVEMISTGSGWHPAPSCTQPFTMPKVSSTTCAALAGLLWWVSCRFFCDSVNRLITVLLWTVLLQGWSDLGASRPVTLLFWGIVWKVLNIYHVLNLLTSNSKFQNLYIPGIKWEN